jgi:hypothetical protein
MFPSRHPCIVTSKRESLSGLSHHLVKERTIIKKGIRKNMSRCNMERIGGNQNKRICRICSTSTQKNMDFDAQTNWYLVF